MITDSHKYAMKYIHKSSQLNPAVNSVTLLDRIKKAAYWALKKSGERRTKCSTCGEKKLTAPFTGDQVCFDCYVGHDTSEVMNKI